MKKYIDPIQSWKRDADFKANVPDERSMQLIRSDSRRYTAFLDGQVTAYRNWRYRSN